MRSHPLLLAAVSTVAAIATASPARADDELQARVLVLPVEGSAPKALGMIGRDVGDALARGAARTTTDVSRSTATLAETAVIVGCEPSEAGCLDAVAAALNVDQLLIAQISAAEGDAVVAITAVTREAQPVEQSFTIHQATRKDDLRSLEEAVPVMLEAGEARKHDRKVEPDPPPDDHPPPPDPHPIETPAPRISWTPLYVAGSGAAVAFAGVIFWGLAAGKQDQIDGASTATADDLDRLSDLESQARLRATFGNVLVIGGSIAVAGGIGWWLYQRRGSDRSVSVAPAPMPGGGGVAIGGTW